ncbi:unnamed protein product [Bursaphelenchus xylophilus]|nr:unnamed protein product [Bursaphelenchus xylophilus]CAG9129150.1 unnamed protein product [Bursaphelenchus xylophilus]
MMLRARDNNQNAESRRQPLKPVASKHKNAVGSDEPKAKKAALGDITHALSSYQIDSTKKKCSSITFNNKKNKVERLLPLKDVLEAEELEVDPCPEVDFDRENSHDPNAVSEFARDIFKYLKWREPLFIPGPYMQHHKNVDNKTRAVLVDWLIEIQEAFEQNHETLYMAVNLVDRFFTKTRRVQKEHLQLVGCAAILVAAKVEERSAPLIDDLIYLVKDAFDAKKLKKMEQELLATVGFDLCSPLSYSFLRRYGRVIKSDMSLLTLARYILEVSLHFLDFCRVSPSKMGAASLLLALRMTKAGEWNKVLQKYSGYTTEDLESLSWALNHMLVVYRQRYPEMKMVWGKYSHEVFFEVAKTPALKDKYPTDSPIGPQPKDLAAAEGRSENQQP